MKISGEKWSLNQTLTFVQTDFPAKQKSKKTKNSSSTGFKPVDGAGDDSLGDFLEQMFFSDFVGTHFRHSKLCL